MVWLMAFIAYCTEVLYPLGLAFRTVDRPLVAHGVGGQAKVVMACEVPVGIAGLPGIMSVMVTMDRIPWLVPVGLMKAMGGHVRRPEAEIQWTRMRGKPISKIEYVRSVGHAAFHALQL